jgi:hypothetical protein
MITLYFVLHPHLHGWRWAIHMDVPPTVRDIATRSCCQAGFGLSRQDADLAGQVSLYTLMAFCDKRRMAYRVQPLDFHFDIVPAGDLLMVTRDGGITIDIEGGP